MSYKIAIDSCGELLDEWKNDGRIESIPLTLTVGGAIGGYCSTGRPTRAARPASVTTIDRTLAKIGRRMQKSEITGRAPGQSLAAGFWPAAACAAAASSGDSAFTGTPGASFRPPSTTMRSPSFVLITECG